MKFGSGYLAELVTYRMDVIKNNDKRHTISK